MIQKWIKNIKLNRGFTIAEAIFSVFITILVIWILQNLLINLKTANKIDHHTDNIAFAYVQFNRFIKNEDTKLAYTLPSSSNFTKAVLVKVNKKDERIYSIEKYKNMIRVVGNEGGHMPLLLNVNNASFQTQDGQIKINVIEKDGRRSELYFKFDPRPVETKREKNEKKTTKKIKSKHDIK